MHRRLVFSFCLGLVVSTLDAQVAGSFNATFDALATNLPLTPGNGTTLLGVNWDYAVSNCGARARVLDASVTNASLPTGFPIPPASSGTATNGAKFVVFDRAVPLPTGCAPTDSFSTNTAALHINGQMLASGAGFTIKLDLCEINDETNPEDVIALTDGQTAGFAVTRTGAAATTLGYGGHKEVLLLDWNTAGANLTWQEYTFTVTPAFLAATGLVMSNDMRLLIRQRDNLSTASGNDGLAFDFVRIEPVAVGNGQAPQPTLAMMDLNGAIELSGNPVSSGLPGPYFINVSQGGALNFTFSGVANQPVVLLAGDLNVAAVTYAFGKLDIGTPNPPGPPTGIVIVADGNSTAGFGPFFRLNASGDLTFQMSSMGIPAGSVTTFQTAVFTGGPNVIALSNAVKATF